MFLKINHWKSLFLKKSISPPFAFEDLRLNWEVRVSLFFDPDNDGQDRNGH